MSSQAAVRAHKDHARNGRAAFLHRNLRQMFNNTRELESRAFPTDLPRLSMPRASAYSSAAMRCTLLFETIRFPLCVFHRRISRIARVDRWYRGRKKFVGRRRRLIAFVIFSALLNSRCFSLACFHLRARARARMCASRRVVSRVRFPVPREHNRASRKINASLRRVAFADQSAFARVARNWQPAPIEAYIFATV